MELILASRSPRRRELLERMGLTRFRILSPEIDERMDRQLPPAELVERISMEKAAAAQVLAGPEALLIAADTVVALDGAVLGKPAGPEDAARMLRALSGRRHQVYTGLTVMRGGLRDTQHEATEVAFRPLTDGEIADYIATGEPLDKAGAYGIQGYGALFVEGIRGDYYNVMGLPVHRLGRMLARQGVDCLALAAGRTGEVAQ